MKNFQVIATGSQSITTVEKIKTNLRLLHTNEFDSSLADKLADGIDDIQERLGFPIYPVTASCTVETSWKVPVGAFKIDTIVQVSGSVDHKPNATLVYENGWSYISFSTLPTDEELDIIYTAGSGKVPGAIRQAVEHWAQTAFEVNVDDVFGSVFTPSQTVEKLISPYKNRFI